MKVLLIYVPFIIGLLHIYFIIFDVLDFSGFKEIIFGIMGVLWTLFGIMDIAFKQR